MALFRRSGGVGVGIDLGTSNIVVYQSGKGVVYDEPSCVSVRKLPRGAPYRVAVYPRNCFGGTGKPIRSDVRHST